MQNDTNFAQQTEAQPSGTQGAPQGNPQPGPDREPYTRPAGAAPGQPRKVRRVGTFTLGTVLVATGALLLVKIFVPAFDLNTVLRYSPVLLILLGIEVLVYATRPDVTLKYDFLSIFVCFIVICGAACAGLAVKFAAYYDPQRGHTLNRLESELEDQTYTTLKPQSTLIRDLSVNLWIDDFAPTDASALTVANLSASPDTTAELYVTFSGQYPSAEAFAADCKTVLAAVRAAGLPFTEYRFDSWQGAGEDEAVPRFSLQAGNPWLLEADAAELANRVEQEWFFDGDDYPSEKARNEAMARATAESAAEAEDRYQSGYDDGYQAGQADAAEGAEQTAMITVPTAPEAPTPPKAPDAPLSPAA